MSLPTYIDHCNRIGIEHLDRRPYLERYLDAKGLDKKTYGEVAFLAFNLVRATFRLEDISQSEREKNEQRISAQEAEIVGWEQKAERYLDGRPGRTSTYYELIADFGAMAVESRVPDADEREHMALGISGRIGDVVVAPEVAMLAWQSEYYDPRDSAFAGK